MSTYHVRASRLSSGYWHLRGKGPEEWAQPPTWPCDEATLREHAGSGASEDFVRACMRMASAGEAT